MNEVLVILVALPFCIHVKGANDLKALLLKSAVTEQRASEISDTNEDHRLQPRRAQEVGNHFRQLLDVVAKPARTELPEVSEVFAKLCGLNSRSLGQCFA